MMIRNEKKDERKKRDSDREDGEGKTDVEIREDGEKKRC